MLAHRKLKLLCVLLLVTTAGTRSHAFLPVPEDTVGNGPYAMLVCQSDLSGSGTRDCNGSTVITSAATLQASLAAPPTAFESVALLPPAFPFVFSWNLAREPNLWNNGAGTAGLRARGVFYATSSPANDDMDVDTFYNDGNDLVRYPLAVTGFVFVPANFADWVKTIAVGSDDGAFLVIQGCASANGFTCDSGNPIANYVLDNIGAGHDLTYGGMKVIFPAAGGLFPFQLLLYNTGAGTSNSAFEFAWADGDQTTQLPTWTGGATNAWNNPGNLSLVPATSLFAPDVHAALVVSPLATVVNAGGTLTYTATIVNSGKAAAYSLSGTSGLEFRLALPISGFSAITSISINGTPLSGPQLTAAKSANAQNLFATVNFSSPAAIDGTLLPGEANAATIAVTATLSNSAHGTFAVQGRVRGHGTDPAVITGQAVVPPQTLYVYTNDPAISGVGDSGNGPSALATATGTPLIVDGGDDDDATPITIGSATIGAPTVNAFPSDTVSTLTPTTLTGIVPGGSATPVVVTLAGVLQSDCVDAGAPANPWFWSSANVCTCRTATAGNAWSCDPINLKDCFTGLCYTATPVIEDSYDIGPAGTAYSFGTATTDLIFADGFDGG